VPTPPSRASANRKRHRTRSALSPLALALCLVATIHPNPATAAVPTVNLPSPDATDTANTGQTGGAFGFLNGMERSNYLLGDMWGVRPLLSQYGMSLGILDTEEVFGNATGGVHRGAGYDGLTQVVLQLDTQRAFGWYGGTFNASALQLHGRNLGADNLDTFLPPSGIQGDRATRLWELWYQQKFLDEDRLDVRVGQQSLDQEFMVSQNANYFVNTGFGWPLLPSIDLPGGGPAYPLSALGVRVRGRPTDDVTILAGVFNGSPASSNSGDAQQVNASGTNFPLNGGVLAIAELQYAYPSLGTMVMANESEPLSRLYKIGAWYNTENFSDLLRDNTGLSLANSASNGNALAHHGNYAIYAVADQMVWRSFDEPDRNINLFFRVMGTPDGDRNLIAFSMNAGLTFHEPFLQRDDDTFGIGMGFAQVSSRAAALDRDTSLYSGTAVPVRGGETTLEAFYQYQVAPWLQLQPDLQYVFNPGAGLPNPNGTGAIKNELILGVRTNILF
jgi:porin